MQDPGAVLGLESGTMEEVGRCEGSQRAVPAAPLPTSSNSLNFPESQLCHYENTYIYK